MRELASGCGRFLKSFLMELFFMAPGCDNPDRCGAECSIIAVHGAEMLRRPTPRCDNPDAFPHMHRGSAQRGSVAPMIRTALLVSTVVLYPQTHANTGKLVCFYVSEICIAPGAIYGRDISDRGATNH